MRRRISLCLLSLLSFSLISLPLIAQDLPRKGSLGVHMGLNSEGTMIEVQKVIPNSTASEMGLELGDLILTVNETEFREVQSFVDAIGTWRKGDPLKMEVKRGKRTKKLAGTVHGRPLETSEIGTLHYGHVDYDGGRLRSILELPKGVENPPVIFFLPGIGCGTLDYYYSPANPIKQLVESFVKRGYAVYRVEKPGMGDSENEVSCWEMDFEYEVAAFETALLKLKTIPAIDAQAIYLYGHSLGATTAPLIAAKHPVAGIICWGGNSLSWYEYELKRIRVQGAMLGRDYEALEAKYRAHQPFLYDFFVNKMGPEELRKRPEYADVVGQYFEDGSPLFYGMHHYKYIQQLNEPNLPKAWKEANCPVLALHGECDLAAIDPDWAKHTADMVSSFAPGMGSWQVVPGTNHHYTDVKTLDNYVQMREDGSYGGAFEEAHFNASVVNRTCDWIESIKIP